MKAGELHMLHFKKLSLKTNGRFGWKNESGKARLLAFSKAAFMKLYCNMLEHVGSKFDKFGLGQWLDLPLDIPVIPFVGFSVAMAQLQPGD